MARSTASICTCEIALKGDKRTIVFREFHNPVSWPELRLIATMHGKGAITNVLVIGERETSRDAEIERLRAIYGAKAVDNVYPGAFPDIQMKAPASVPRGDPPKHTKPALPEDLDPEPFEGLNDEDEEAAA